MLHANPSSICPGSRSRASQALYLLLRGTGTYVLLILTEDSFQMQIPLKVTVKTSD